MWGNFTVKNSIGSNYWMLLFLPNFVYISYPSPWVLRVSIVLFGSETRPNLDFSCTWRKNKLHNIFKWAYLHFQNVDKYFAVVGVLEEWDKSLQVLEHFLPRYFQGSTELFATGKVAKVVNKNLYKPKTSALIREMIAKNITREIEFYNYCKQRLYKQYLSILW